MLANVEPSCVLLAYDGKFNRADLNQKALCLVLTDSFDESATAIAGKRFDLIIIDIALNGMALIALAKTTDSINCQTPIIALLGSDDTDLKKRLIADGFDDCLAKPLTESKLTELADFWLDSECANPLLESTQALLVKFRQNKKVVLTLYEKLFEDLPQQVDQTETALKSGQYQLALDAIHNIISYAKICHLSCIEALAKSLEDCLKQARYDLSEAYFSMLSNGIDKLYKHRQPIKRYLGDPD